MASINKPTLLGDALALFAYKNTDKCKLLLKNFYLDHLSVMLRQKHLFLYPCLTLMYLFFMTHTLCNQEVSTFERELCAGKFHGTIWVILCAQLMEVIRYLHEEPSILHNEIKGDNILLTRALQPEEDCQYQIVLIDFGKAMKIAESRRYHLTLFKQSEYIRKCPHIPPEVIEESNGKVGGVIYML